MVWCFLESKSSLLSKNSGRQGGYFFFSSLKHHKFSTSIDQILPTIDLNDWQHFTSAWVLLLPCSIWQPAVDSGGGLGALCSPALGEEHICQEVLAGPEVVSCWLFYFPLLFEHFGYSCFPWPALMSGCTCMFLKTITLFFLNNLKTCIKWSD